MDSEINPSWLAGIPIVLIVLIALLLFAFEVWMFVDAIRNKKLTDTEKLLWCAGMVLLHPVVAIVYYFIVYAKRTRK